MLLSTQTHRYSGYFGDAKAVKMLSQAGFDALDFSMLRMNDDNNILCSDNYREHVMEVRAVAEKAGVAITQAHAPFTFNWSDPGEFDNVIIPRIVRSIEIASLLGAKLIVVHPLHHLVYKGHEKQIKQANMAYYRSLLPVCEKYDIKIALENMWQKDNRRNCIVQDTCSCPEDFIDYLDTLNDDHFVACLDIGHCVLTGEDPAEMIRALGPKRLQALHIQDNDFLSDAHRIPYTGKIDWNAVTSALGQIGYQGDFTFEADRALSFYDKEFLPTVSRYMVQLGRHMITKIEKAANAVRVAGK